ncbi:MAG: TIGR00268 family protein [Methanobacterium sp. Maddingley MBC34]|nr:MAG: TIGR00268 family protein [Methanobacterium sp. Maddingley MBC34]
MDIKGKMDRLRDYLHGKKVVVAFSGGADSTLLAWLAKEEAKDAMAVTVDNGVMPAECVQNAEQIAQKIGIKHLVVRENFLEDLAFEINPPNRCYVCKMKMHQRLEKIAKKGHYDAVVDGTNISDLMEDRPGIMVNIEKNVKTPLVKSGFTSPDVKEVLKQNNMDYNPSTTCFATRIPTGKAITSKKINRISYAENLIKNLTGLEVVRVRDDDGMARIEVQNVDKLIDRGLLHHLDLELKAVGFRRVTLDISGHDDSKDQMMIYKPCKGDKNKIMFETELPYHFNISETCLELETLGKVKCSKEMGIVMLEIEGTNFTLFANGKIVARKVRGPKEAQELLFKVLPCLRRQITNLNNFD